MWVADVAPRTVSTRDDVLRLAGAAEAASEHPIAQAVAARAATSRRSSASAAAPASASRPWSTACRLVGRRSLLSDVGVLAERRGSLRWSGIEAREDGRRGRLGRHARAWSGRRPVKRLAPQAIAELKGSG